MRTIEEIKADIASCEACEKHKSICDRKCPICKHIHDSNKDMFENELLCALTSDIPLDRLEVICKAEKDGRCVIVPENRNLKVLKVYEWILEEEIRKFYNYILCKEKSKEIAAKVITNVFEKIFGRRP